MSIVQWISLSHKLMSILSNRFDMHFVHRSNNIPQNQNEYFLIILIEKIANNDDEINDNLASECMYWYQKLCIQNLCTVDLI
jgi:hypothetical protein